MNESVKELIAIGASVGSHCQPCLEHHLQAAIELGVPEEEIREAVEIGHRVEKGAMAAMKKFSAAAVTGLSVTEVPGNLPNEPSAAASDGKGKDRVLKVFDPALCCSSGVCGPSVDPILAQFAGALNYISGQPGIHVERYNLGQEPRAFVENTEVKSMLGNGGEKRLPFLFIDDQLWLQGRYPSRDELMQVLNIKGGAVILPASPAPESSPCCGEEGCC